MANPTLTYGEVWMHDGDDVSNWIEVRPVVMHAAGYVACVAGDKGKMVHEAGADFGYLQDYDNATYTWWIATDTLPADDAVMLVDGGSGGAGGTTTNDFGASNYLHGAAITVSNSDYAKIACAVGSDDGDECFYTYYTHKATSDTNIAVYVGTTGLVAAKQLLIRYKTNSDHLGLAIKLVYSDATTEWALGTDTVPVYSTGSYFMETTYTIVAGLKTLDHIRLYAVAEDDTDGTEAIYVDFLDFVVGTFTFPFISKSVKLSGINNYAYLPRLEGIGNNTQYLGGESCPITITGHIDTATGWHDAAAEGATDLGHLLRILQESNTQAWQWFTCDVPELKLKVTLDSWDLTSEGTEDSVLDFIINLHEYRRGSASPEIYWERFGTYP